MLNMEYKALCSFYPLEGPNSNIININSFSRLSIKEMLMYGFCPKYSDTGGEKKNSLDAYKSHVQAPLEQMGNFKLLTPLN